MSLDVDLSNSGFSREDRILARVVLDLGLVRPADIENAARQLTDGGGPTLAQILQESGSLNPRFLSTVERVVKNRLAARKKSDAGRPPTRALVERPGSSRLHARPATDAEKKQVLPSLGPPTPGRDADVDRLPVGQTGTTRPGRDGDVVRTTRQRGEAGSVDARVEPKSDAGDLIEAAFDKQAPGGENQAVPGAHQAGAEAVPPTDEPPGPEGPSSEPGRKEVTVRAFVKRVVPDLLHQQCLETVLRKRLGVVSAARLRRECGCGERDAKRVLETWRSAGVARRSTDENEILQYHFTPSKTDLALTRKFMVMWEDPQTHNMLLGWILGQE